MNIDDVLSRADESILEEIIGSQTVRILATLDQTRTYNRYLRKLVISLHGYDGLLLNKTYRTQILDLLKPAEAEQLYTLLGSPKGSSNIYTSLKERTFSRGSKAEETLFSFFSVPLPSIETTANTLNPELVESKYPLFEHQRIAARKVRELIGTPPYRVLLHMPTGAGKTRTAMNVVCDHFRENEYAMVIWLASTEELCEQAASEFEKAWTYLGNRDLNVHRYWGSFTVDIDTLKKGFLVAGLPKTVRTAQSTGGIDFISKLASRCTLVVMDEAHQAVAPMYRVIIDALFYIGQENRLLGLSATPGRTWNDIVSDEELAQFFSKRKVKLEVSGYDNPIDFLTKEGYLAEITYRQLFHNTKGITPKELEVISESMDIPTGVLKKLGEDEQRNIKIIYETEKLAKNHKRIILFAPSVDCSDLLSCVLQARGYKAYSVTSKTPPHRRYEIIQDFKSDSDEPKILCNYGVLTTGFDAPQTSAAVIARPTTSLVLYSQMIGRAIRGTKAGGNAKAEIVTVVDYELPGFRTVAESFNNWEDVWE